MHLDRPAAGGAARAHHAVGQQADGQHVVEVRVADQDVVDARQRVERQVADAGAGVDQHVVVEQEGRGPAAGRDGAGTAEDGEDHLLSKVRVPSQPGGSGWLDQRAMRSPS